MSTSAELISAGRGLPALRDRLDRLERRCAELWRDEPRSSGNREQALERLADLEYRIVALMLRSLGGHDEPSLAVETDRCEQDLERLAECWSAAQAA